MLPSSRQCFEEAHKIYIGDNFWEWWGTKWSSKTTSKRSDQQCWTLRQNQTQMCDATEIKSWPVKYYLQIVWNIPVRKKQPYHKLKFIVLLSDIGIARYRTIKQCSHRTTIKQCSHRTTMSNRKSKNYAVQWKSRSDFEKPHHMQAILYYVSPGSGFDVDCWVKLSLC